MSRFFLQDALDDESRRFLGLCHNGIARGSQQPGLTVLDIVTIFDQTVGV